MSLRQRQEVQEMLRGLSAIFFFSAAVSGAVFPPQIGAGSLKSESPAAVAGDTALWSEYGLESATTGDYGAFRATAYRFKDATGAFAAEQWLHAADATATLDGNYVVTCKGHCPRSKDLAHIQFPGERHAAEPIAYDYLPEKGVIPGSERYVVGPAGLEKFAPQIPPAMAAFRFGTEAGIAKYRTPKGPQELVLLSFPTPSMARQQASQLQTLSGAVVQRQGPLLAVVPNAPDSAAATALLSQIHYDVTVSWDQKPPVVVTPQSVGKMIIAICQLAGFLILFCIAAGLGFAGIRQLQRRLGTQTADEAMIVLHLLDR